ncbi:MAG TPA: helix-turn-helix domain-containing protein [Pararhizobium sp.]|uniref:helix-turn-helix domain-containing protein n=1 Tax=Pararhizobium sp. TaxID=1977563 RepID=UPI002C3561ED|nr:helix-turn-helix domain-containing protein [Pararhizobium sp.]HTO29634.1 helix-turn-helix domain-containing protein [Pararhizobium sp.]
MSFDATNWAIKQRGMKPATKIVLWHLCDRFHPDHGCFPSQDTLANDCEMSRSTLNVHLDALEGSGLILRIQSRRAGSRQQERTKYHFPFEPDFAVKKAQKPCPETGHGFADAVSENDEKPCPENDDSRVRNPDSNPVREPVREPVNLREGAGEEAEDPKKIEAAFWKLVKDWPGFDGMPKKPAMTAWFKLSALERGEAAERFPAWLALLKAQRKDHTPAPSTYFGEKLWRDVPAMQEAAKPKNAMAAAFGKLWGASRLAELLIGVTGPISAVTATEKHMIDAGQLTLDGVIAEKRRKMGYPSVNTMHERARSRQGWICPLTLETAASGFAQVHRDSDLMQAWRREHKRRNWPFPDNGSLPEWIYFPAIANDADGLDLAVRDAVDAFAETISDYLKERSKGDDDAA